MEYIFGLIALLLGALGYNVIRRRSAEALLQNNEIKSKLNEQDKDKARNDGLLAAEEEKRADSKSNGDARKDQPVKPDDF